MNEKLNQNNLPLSIMLNLVILVILAGAIQSCQKSMEDIYYVERMDQQEDSPGNLVDIDWSHARLLNDFVSPWQQAPTNTIFRALYDDDFFYFRFDVKESNILVYRNQNDEQEVVRSERVEIFFRQDERLDPYFGLEMDASGRVYDYQAHHYRKFEPQWTWPEGQLEVRSKRLTDGYTVMGKVGLESLKTLGLMDGNRLQAGLYRGRCTQLQGGNAEFHWISWIDPKTEQPDFHVASSFGALVFIK